MKTTFKIEGGAELAAALNSLSDRLSRRIQRDVLEQAAEPIRKAMSQLAPRAPGAPDIADHMVISPARVEGLGDMKATALAIGPERGDFFYGHFLEFGTSRQGAQPFARPAFDSGVDEALRTITSGLWTELAAKGISRTVNAPTTVRHDGPLT